MKATASNESQAHILLGRSREEDRMADVGEEILKVSKERKDSLALTGEMKRAIERSGYLFEQRLVPLIERAGFKAMANYQFRRAKDDPTPRELDIYGVSAKRITRQRDFIWLSLLLECKNLRCPLVFFAQKEIRLRMFLGSPHISGLPRHGFARNKYVDLEDYLKLERFHHYYYRGKTSTQFCAV